MPSHPQTGAASPEQVVGMKVHVPCWAPQLPLGTSQNAFAAQKSLGAHAGDATEVNIAWKSGAVPVPVFPSR